MGIKKIKRVVKMSETTRFQFIKMKRKIENEIKEIITERKEIDGWNFCPFKNRKYSKVTGSFASHLENSMTRDIDLYVCVSNVSDFNEKKLLSVFNGIESALLEKLSVQSSTSTKSSIDFIDQNQVASIILVTENNNQLLRVYKVDNEKALTIPVNKDFERKYNNTLMSIDSKNKRRAYRVITKVIKIFSNHNSEIYLL